MPHCSMNFLRLWDQGHTLRRGLAKVPGLVQVRHAGRADAWQKEIQHKESPMGLKAVFTLFFAILTLAAAIAVMTTAH